MTVQATAGRPFRVVRVFTRCGEALSSNLAMILTVVGLFSVLPDIGFATWHLAAGHLAPDAPVEASMWYLLDSFLGGLIALGATIGVIFISVCHFEGRRVSLAEVLGRIGQAFIGAFAIQFLVSLAVGFGLVLLIVPGVWMAVTWVPAMAVKVMERNRQMSTLERASELTAGFRGPVLGAMAIAAVVILGLLFLSGLIPIDPTLYRFTLLPVTNAFAVVSMALFTASIYQELKVAHEGLSTANVFS